MKSTQQRFENEIGSHDELPVHFHQFQLEESTDWLMFHFDVKKPKSWLKVFVWDPNGMLRLQYLHVNAPTIVVLHKEAYQSSALAVPGPLPLGEWKIEVSGGENKSDLYYTIDLEMGKDKIPYQNTIQPIGEDLWLKAVEGENNFTYNLYDWEKRIKTEKRWYKGDFHTHTLLSDGSLTPEEGMRQAEKMDLDFFVTTEHHMMTTGWVKGKALPIPGVEVTSSKGHFNALGPKQWIDWRTTNQDGGMETEGGIQRILEDVKRAGAIRSINHPMLEPWHWQFKETLLTHFDVMEIWNDPTFPDNVLATEKALVLWNTLWNDGQQIYGIGGSDSHLKPTESYVEGGEPSVIGDPGTFVYSEGLSANEILAGVRSGHVYVSRGPLMEFTITIDEENYLVGSNLEAAIEHAVNKEIKYDVKLSNVLEDSVIHWIENGETIRTEPISGDGNFQNSFIWDPSTYTWGRIEIRAKDGRLLAFNNPIYTGTKQPVIQTWGDLLVKAGFKEDAQN